MRTANLYASYLPGRVRAHAPAAPGSPGQAESGKSTMIKNFQLSFCPNAFKAEAEAWRAVIHLNLARFVNYLLHVLAAASDGKDYRILRMRLSPLKQVELILTRVLSAETSGPGSPTSPTGPLGDGRALRADAAPPSSPEVSVRSGSGWKTLMRRRRGSQVRHSAMADELEDARKILDACKDDIAALWKASSTQIVSEAGLDLHHHAR